MNKLSTLLSSSFLLLVFSCGVPSGEPTIEVISGTSSSIANTEEMATAPLPIQGTDFSIRTKTLADKDNMPSAAFYIYSTIANDSILLAIEHGGLPVDDPEQRKTWNIPKNSVFTLHSYYAAGSHLYYGIAEENTLKVYKKSLTEIAPNQEQAPTASFSLFKTYLFYPDSIATINPIEEESR